MAGFKAAFAAARKAGKKTFTWNGKPYTTKLASDSKSSGATKTSARPKARPKATAKTSKPTGAAGRAAARKKSSTNKGASYPRKGKMGLVNKMTNKAKKTSSGSAGRRRRRNVSGSDR